MVFLRVAGDDERNLRRITEDAENIVLERRDLRVMPLQDIKTRVQPFSIRHPHTVGTRGDG